MGIGAIGTLNYCLGYQNKKAFPKTGTKSFADSVNSVASTSQHLVIHGIMGEKTENGDTVVGAWGDAIAGTSTTVYKPKDFDEDNPVYYMKIWDNDGNVTERTVNLNEVNPRNCSAFDLYAYCCYASDTGKCPTAMSDFMMADAHYRGELGGGSAYEDLFKATDWLAVVKEIMGIQYRLGNLNGYMKYQGFLEFLGSKS